MADGQLLAGVAAATAAACCFDGAVILQAAEARAVPPEHGLRLSLLTRLFSRPRWLLGTAIAIFGWPLQLLALSLAPITVVQPMLALGLIVLLIGGHRVLNEPVGRTEWAAAAIIVIGLTGLTLLAPQHTVDTPKLGAASIVAITLGAVVAAPYLIRPISDRAWPLILSAGCAFALAALTSKMLTNTLSGGHMLPALAWAAATAAFAGVGFLADMTAMQHHPATRVAPPMFVLEIALPVALAPALFNEHTSSTSGAGLLIAGALVLVVAGGVILGRSRPTA